MRKIICIAALAAVPAQADEKCQLLRDFHVSYIELAAQFPAIAGIAASSVISAQIRGQIGKEAAGDVALKIIDPLNAAADVALDTQAKLKRSIDEICP